MSRARSFRLSEDHRDVVRTFVTIFVADLLALAAGVGLGLVFGSLL